ncbi:MAG TPA: 5-(carboxyamino)imidazole ribonucleotide mutase, partial [Syntrophorhabdus aromaticivorans]|nr:5-(carboxyamino)imidazole ribonucleotide mutase [Syntrophorhabdus aromaticivorans]
ALGGLDALYATVQMPKGIPVATVGIDASRNAAILACKILSIKHDEIRQKLEKIKMDMQRRNDEKSLKLNRYLED